MTAAAVAVAVAAVATFAALAAISRRLPVTHDEAWFLQVVVRCGRGDVLYRDVFFGAGPLSVWLARKAVRAFASELLVLRLLNSAYFTAILVAGAWVLAEASAAPGAGAPAVAIAAFWLASFAFAAPPTTFETHYTHLALLGAVVATGAVLAAGPDGSPGWLVLAGAAAGASFAAKQNIGLAAVAAVAVAAERAAGGAAGLAWYGLGVAAVLVACTIPLLVAGAFRWYGRRGFLYKTTYFATAGVSPLDGIRQDLRGELLVSRNRARAALVVTMLAATYLVLPVMVLAGVAAAVHGDGPAVPAVLGLAAVAAVALVPRADVHHVRGAFPVAALTVALAAAGLPVDAAAVVPALAVLIGVALVRLARTARRGVVWGEPAVRDAPHFHGVPVARTATGASPTEGAALRDATGGRVFVLRPDAAFWYLAGDLENPTPYDYPYASVFGPHGQQEVVDGVRAGRIAWVCWDEPLHGPLRPALLEDFISGSMVPAATTPAGTLYRMPAADG